MSIDIVDQLKADARAIDAFGDWTISSRLLEEATEEIVGLRSTISSLIELNEMNYLAYSKMSAEIAELKRTLNDRSS